MVNRKRAWRIVAISLVSLMMGVTSAGVGLVVVVAYLLATRSLHTSGAFPVHIYDIPLIIGIWVMAGAFKLGCVIGGERAGAPPEEGFRPRNSWIILTAVVASIAVYVFTEVTSAMSG